MKIYISCLSTWAIHIRSRTTDIQNELRQRQWLWSQQRQELRWRSQYIRAFNRGSPAPKPVEVGKEYEVDVTEISRQGDGVARVQGFVVFVKNGKVKQNVKVQVDQVGDRFATATLVDQIYNNT